MHSDFEPILSRDTSAAHGPNDNPVINDLRSELRTAWAKVSRLEQSEYELSCTVSELKIELEDSKAQLRSLRDSLISQNAIVPTSVSEAFVSVGVANDVLETNGNGSAFSDDEAATSSPDDTLLSRGEFAAMRSELKRADLRINQLMSDLEEAREASCPNELFQLRAELAEAQAQIERQTAELKGRKNGSER